MHGFIKIPEVRQHDRQVMPDVIGPYQQAQAPASAFGQDIARGMGRLSMGLDKLNQQLQFNAQNQNRVQLNEELNLAQNRAAEFENKYMQNNQGANALNTEKDFLAYNQKNREQLLFKYAADPLAKQRINQLFDVNDLAAARRGLEYANQQSRAYDSQVFEQVLSEVGHTLSDPASSLESRELARIRLQLYWDDTAGRLGLDPEQVHQATDEALHNWELHRAYVYLGQGENNPQRALDEIKQYLQNRENEQDIDSPLSPLSNNELNKACAQLQKQVKRRQTLALQTGGLSLKQLREGIYGLKAQDMIKSAQTINALASGGGLDDKQLAQLQDEADDIGAISELLREDGSFVEKRKRLQDSEQEAGPRKRVKRRLAVLEESEKQFKQDPAQFVRARVDADVDTLMRMGGFAQTMRPMLRAELTKSVIRELGGKEIACLLTNEEADQWREQMEEAKTQVEKRALVRQIQQTYGNENGKLVLAQLRNTGDEEKIPEETIQLASLAISPDEPTYNYLQSYMEDNTDTINTETTDNAPADSWIRRAMRDVSGLGKSIAEPASRFARNFAKGVAPYARNIGQGAGQFAQEYIAPIVQEITNFGKSYIAPLGGQIKDYFENIRTSSGYKGLQNYMQRQLGQIESFTQLVIAPVMEKTGQDIGDKIEFYRQLVNADWDKLGQSVDPELITAAISIQYYQILQDFYTAIGSELSPEDKAALENSYTVVQNADLGNPGNAYLLELIKTHASSDKLEVIVDTMSAIRREEED